MKPMMGLSSRRAFLKSSAVEFGSLGRHRFRNFIRDGTRLGFPNGPGRHKGSGIGYLGVASRRETTFRGGKANRLAAGAANSRARRDSARRDQQVPGYSRIRRLLLRCRLLRHQPASRARTREATSRNVPPFRDGIECEPPMDCCADSAATLYSYDDGDADPDLRRFSIDHDREYILPILRRVHSINPDVFYFSSPWSPPGWMKWNKSMLGGSMSRQYLASYAQYFLKFIQAYGAEGVPIRAITTQNEIDTDQHGQMPACTWSQECETEFITDHLGPLFEKNNYPAKIWILDHNFVYWGRVISELDNPDFRRYVNSVAWHPYTGDPSMMSKVHAAHPEVEMYFTEGSTDYNDPHYQDDWTKWSKTYTDVLTNWCRAAVAWNMATDERGKPNIGPYPCGGILIINPHTQEIVRSGQYWALAHFSRTIRRGARRFESQSQAANLGHVAVENPDGQNVLVLTNLGAARTVELNHGLSSANIPMEENSLATLVWK